MTKNTKTPNKPSQVLSKEDKLHPVYKVALAEAKNYGSSAHAIFDALLISLEGKNDQESAYNEFFRVYRMVHSQIAKKGGYKTSRTPITRKSDTKFYLNSLELQNGNDKNDKYNWFNALKEIGSFHKVQEANADLRKAKKEANADASKNDIDNADSEADKLPEINADIQQFLHDNPQMIYIIKGIISIESKATQKDLIAIMTTMLPSKKNLKDQLGKTNLKAFDLKVADQIAQAS